MPLVTGCSTGCYTGMLVGVNAGSLPDAPTNVAATASSQQVTITWDSVDGADSYNIYWATSSPVTQETGTKITGATSPHVHSSLTNDTTYYYVVTTVVGSKESEDSSEVNDTPFNLFYGGASDLKNIMGLTTGPQAYWYFSGSSPYIDSVGGITLTYNYTSGTNTVEDSDAPNLGCKSVYFPNTGMVQSTRYEAGNTTDLEFSSGESVVFILIMDRIAVNAVKRYFQTDKYIAYQVSDTANFWYNTGGAEADIEQLDITGSNRAVAFMYRRDTAADEFLMYDQDGDSTAQPIQSELGTNTHAFRLGGQPAVAAAVPGYYCVLAAWWGTPAEQDFETAFAALLTELGL